MKWISQFVIAVLLLTGGACSGDDEAHKMDQSEHGHEHTTMEAGEPTGHSIYHAGSSWIDHNGQELMLEDLQGMVQVMAMVYTHCDYACPRIVADMKRIQSSLSGQEMQNTNFVIVSIDSERDTPERLAEFASENKMSSEHWTLLHGDSGDIMELAALLGVKYKRVSETDFSHSNIITVLNRQGEIAYQQMKLGDQTDHIVKVIKELARQE